MITTDTNRSPDGVSPPAAGTMSVSRAILYATLAVGVLDAADGVVVRGVQGQTPIQVLQYIASSLLGARAFSEGLGSAGLGLALHFATALVVTTIYILASRRATVLRTQWVLFGLLYGAAVWVVMNLVVLRFTAVVSSPITTSGVVNGVLGHAAFVGLPSAFFARKAAA